jgi:hypothetical protein
MGLGDFDSASKVLDESLRQGKGLEISEPGGLIRLEILRVRCCALSGQAEAALQIAQALHARVPESFDAGICLADQQIVHGEFELAKALLDAIKPTDQGQQIKKILTLRLNSLKRPPNSTQRFWRHKRHCLVPS